MKRKSLFYPFVFCTIICFAFSLVVYPKNTAQAVRDALVLCAQSVIPTLFPFFVVSKLITKLRFENLFEKIFKRMIQPLFSLDAAVSPAIVLGFIGGYPVGAATVTSLYNEKICSKEEAERALAFCNNCGPAFFIGAIGSGVFSSAKTGISLLIIHILSAVLVGIIFRIISPLSQRKIIKKSNKTTCNISFSKAFTDSVLSALNSCLNISAYVVLFSVLICILKLLHFIPWVSYFISLLFDIDKNLVESVITGIFEITVGAYSVIKHSNFETAFVIISFLLGWGGLSVHCQTLSCISDYNLNTKQYFIGKLMHGVISAIIAYVYLTVGIHFPQIIQFLH